jgi:iron complex outermembrane receptor protein
MQTVNNRQDMGRGSIRALRGKLNYAGLFEGLLGLAIIALPTAAQAETASDAADGGQGGAGDIVVTAQKRVESVLDVPLSVSVLGAEQIERAHIVDYADLARSVPGLSFTNTGSSGLSRISMRGIASSSGSATVGVYLNDVALTFPNQFFTGTTLPRLFDIDHVEVLRGPQGTLYGDSSLGGTLRFLTRQPKLGAVEGDVAGDLSVTKGGGTNYELTGAVNVPLGETVALRVAGVTGFTSGFVDHVDATGAVDRKDTNSERYHAARATLLWQAGETLKITPALQWQFTKSADTGIFKLSLPKFRQNRQVREPSRDTLVAPSLTIEKELGDNSLTSVTSYMSRKFDRRIDATIYNSEYVAEVIDPSFGADFDAIAGLPGVLDNVDKITNWSQELRLASPSIRESGRAFEWQVGAYFNTLRAKSLDDEYVFGLNDTVASQLGTTVAAQIGYDAPGDLLGYFHSVRKLKQVAVFAEGSLMVLPGLKATVGVRQAKAWTRFKMNEGGWLADGAPAFESAKDSESPLTPKFALNYSVSDDVSLYASATKGFRLGGQNNSLPSFCAGAISALGLTAASAKSYRSDSIWAYEAGVKTGLFGNRLRINASAYTIDWSNIQQQLRLASCGYVITSNAGDARSRGGELEVVARVTDSLTLSATGGITDAKITKGATGSTAVAGRKVLGVPNKTLTLAMAYDQLLTTYDRPTTTGRLGAARSPPTLYAVTSVACARTTSSACLPPSSAR